MRSAGPGVWVAGLVGRRSERFRRVRLTSEDASKLTIADPTLSYQGDGRLLRTALQAYSLGIGYEFDPYFGLSISRVDPLPHQLEAIYEHLLKLPSVRFLLADKEKFDEKFLVLKGGDLRDQFGVNQWIEQKQVITSLDLAKRTEILPGLRQVRWDLARHISK